MPHLEGGEFDRRERWMDLSRQYLNIVEAYNGDIFWNSQVGFANSVVSSQCHHVVETKDTSRRITHLQQG